MRARRAHSPPAPWLAGLVLGLLLAAGWAFPAAGVEFAAPPGQNVERQEAALKEEVTRLAESLVGDQLVEVIVHIGYARSGKKTPGGPERIKLPGFNRFITPSDGKGVEIVPEFIRLRQVFVVVADTLQADPEEIQRSLITQGEFDPRQGDWVQVVTVPRPPQGGEAGAGAKGGKGEPEEAAPAEAPGMKRPKPPLKEPESTIYLLRARDAYFKRDYDRALNQILKALAVEPNSSQAYAMLGSLYYTINWRSLALKYWEKSLALDPENREVEELVSELRSSS